MQNLNFDGIYKMLDFPDLVKIMTMQFKFWYYIILQPNLFDFGFIKAAPIVPWGLKLLKKLYPIYLLILFFLCL